MALSIASKLPFLKKRANVVTVTPINDPITQPLQQAGKNLDTVDLDGLELDNFTKQRIGLVIQEVASLTDTENGVEQKAQSSVITGVVILAPIITAFLLAYETGAFFYGKDFDPSKPLSWVQFGVAYLLELVLVAIVFEMGKAKKNMDEKQWRTLFGFWLFFVVTSYLGQFMYLYGQYLGGTHKPSPMDFIAVALRCAACCLIDLVCAGYLGRKSKTLEKQVADLEFKGKAISQLTMSVIGLTEKIQESAQRQREESQRQERRRIEDEQVARLRNQIMEAGLSSMQGGNNGNNRGAY